MFLRNSIAKTKKFFHKTIESFKSLLSGGYERLPKAPPFNPCSCTTNSHPSFRDLDRFYTDFSNLGWDSSADPDKKRNDKKSPPPMSMSMSMSKKQRQQPIDNEEIYSGGSFLKFGKQSPARFSRHEEERRRETGKEMRRERGSHIRSESNMRERGGQLVLVQKLKELEMMNASDMEHVLDIEEVLHYYSRLTCPAYLDIVNNFFMDMYSDFTIPQQPSSASSSSSAAKNIHSRKHRF